MEEDVLEVRDDCPEDREVNGHAQCGKHVDEIVKQMEEEPASACFAVLTEEVETVEGAANSSVEPASSLAE